MEGRDPGSLSQEQMDIVWVGKSDSDPFWDRCSGTFGILGFETIYEALAAVLTGLSVRVLVVNALGFGPELKASIKSILSQNIFSGVLIYTTAARIAHYTPNGDGRVMLIEKPEQLFDRLCLLVGKEVPVGEPIQPAETENREAPPVEEKPEPEVEKIQWPLEPPGALREGNSAVVRQEQPVEEAIQTQVEPAQSPGVQPTNTKSPEKEFQAAQLTQEELQALLGSEFESEDGPWQEKEDE